MTLLSLSHTLSALSSQEWLNPSDVVNQPLNPLPKKNDLLLCVSVCVCEFCVRVIFHEVAGGGKEGVMFMSALLVFTCSPNVWGGGRGERVEEGSRFFC